MLLYEHSSTTDRLAEVALNYGSNMLVWVKGGNLVDIHGMNT